jgi:PAS domain S-box-containing protein
MRDRDGVPICIIAVTEDITEKIRAESALRDSEQRLMLAQGAAHVGVWDCDLRTNVSLISGEYARMHGLAPDHPPLTHEEWLESVHPADRERVNALLTESIERTRIWDHEFRVVWPDGSVHWLLGKGEVFLDESGQPVRMVGVNLDITERKRAEEQHSRLAAIVESSDLAIIGEAVDGTIVSWNRGAEKLYRYKAEEMLGRNKSSVIPPARLDLARLVRESLGRGARVPSFETTGLRRDGSEVPISLTLSPTLDSAGAVVGISAIARDITAQKQADAALRESEERFRRVFEEGPLGLALVRRDYHFEKVNSALCQMLGYSEAELLKLSFADITHPDDLRADVELAERLFRCEIPFYNLRKRYVKKNGEIVWINLTASLICNQEGEPIHGIAMIEDITEVKRAQEIENRLASDLEHSRDEIRALAASLMTAQEEERRRISRELHDQICQQLASLALEIGGLAASPLPPENARDKLNQIRARVVQASDEARQIAYNMHSSILDDLGLVASLEDLCSQFSERHPDVALGFEEHDLPAALPSEVASCLYSVAKESLQNIAKHSSAKCVSVALGFKNGAIVLTIQEDGTGFDPTAVRGHRRLGLIGMEERARSVNGKLTIRAHGTQIAVEVPWPDRDL